MMNIAEQLLLTIMLILNNQFNYCVYLTFMHSVKVGFYPYFALRKATLDAE